MAYRSLADFLEQLEQDGQLRRVTAAVDPLLEISEIVASVAAMDGPALLFQNIAGRHAAVAAHLLATPQRICRALQVASLDELATRVTEWLGQGPARGWFDRLKHGAGQAAERWQPKLLKSGACQQVINLASDVDLNELPILQNWPQDAGRSLIAAPLFSRAAQTEERSVSGHDVQVIDRNTLAVFWHRGQPAARHFRGYQANREPMPVAIVLGGDPALGLVAASPLTTELDALELVGVLRGQPLDVVKARTVDLRVPAEADIVIEGLIDPADAPLIAGPLGSSTGYYRLPEPACLLRVTAVTQRVNPIYPALIAGQTGGELAALNKACERILLPLVRQVIPDLVDYNLTGLGGAESLAVVSIRKVYALQAQRVAHAWWGWEPLAFTKGLVVVDETVDVGNLEQVWSAIAASVHPPRDISIIVGSASPLDHSAPQFMVGGKLLIDATSKLPDEHPRPWPAVATMSAEVRELGAQPLGRIRLAWRATFLAHFVALFPYLAVFPGVDRARETNRPPLEY